MSQKNTQTQVLIVGAGPVGLALAIELGHWDISCLVIERNDRVGYAPRAKTTNVRTREHFRRWGIADKLRAASPLGMDYPSNVVFCTRLAGDELTRFENAFYCAPGRNPLYSEHSQWIPQYTVEEVMREHAQSLSGVTLRFRSELQSFRQDGSGVTAVVCDAEGEDFTVTADYLVGADGARSKVRDAIGAKLEGAHGLSRNYNVVFKAPGLAAAHKHGPAVMYWQINGDAPSVLGPMDTGDRWYFMPTGVPEGFKMSADDAAEMIRKATGIDLPYEVLSTDEWTASRLIANTYRDKRVFLAGDACHLHPPFGGYGMNMGVADGVDLGWKLAATLDGWGGSGLLDSYEIERRPVHEMVMSEAVVNHALLGNQLWTPGLEDQNSEGVLLRAETGARIQTAKIREFATLGVVLGYRYDNSPLVLGDGSPAPAPDFINYIPSNRAGAVAPHAWMHDGTSLYDHFGSGFTLVVHADTPAGAVAQATSQARAAKVPLTVLQTELPAMRELYPTRFTLIRPDQHVAWRGDALPPVSAKLWALVSGRAPVPVSESMEIAQ